MSEYELLGTYFLSRWCSTPGVEIGYLHAVWVLECMILHCGMSDLCF